MSHQPVSHQPVVYTPIHKGIRSRLFRISTTAGRMDFTDAGSVTRFQEEFAALVNNIQHHHDLEEEFIHPLLIDRVPEGAEKLEEEHRMVLHLMQNLTNHLNGIIAKPADSEKRREQGLEFYLAYNRFLAYFLEHLNEEEQHIQRSLWDLCSTEEVKTTVGKLLAGQGPDLAMENMEMVMNSANLDELADILREAKPNVPPQAFQGAMAMAQHGLNAQEYAALQSRIS